MPSRQFWSVEAPWEQSRLRAFEPTMAEILAVAPLLAAFYNDSHNSSMMANTEEASATDVVDRFRAMREAGERPFLLEIDGDPVGDADFRRIRNGEAEFAIMVGPRGHQSRGLGTRFAAMLHAAGLRAMGLERIYATVIPQNIASRRMLEKIGYQLDPSERAATFTDDETDIAMSVDRVQFEQTIGDLLAQFAISAQTQTD